MGADWLLSIAGGGGAVFLGAERPQSDPKSLAKSPMFAMGADGSPVPFQKHRQSEWMSITGSSSGEACMMSRSSWGLNEPGPLGGRSPGG